MDRSFEIFLLSKTGFVDETAHRGFPTSTGEPPVELR